MTPASSEARGVAPGQDQREVEERQETVTVLRKLGTSWEKELTDDVIVQLWLPEISARFAYVIDYEEGLAKTEEVVRHGDVSAITMYVPKDSHPGPDCPQGSHSHRYALKNDGPLLHFIGRLVLRDMGRVPSKGLLARIAYLWRAVDRVEDVHRVPSRDERWQAIWDRHFTEAAGQRISAGIWALTLGDKSTVRGVPESFGEGLTTHEQHDFRVWAEKGHGIRKRRTGQARWYEGLRLTNADEIAYVVQYDEADARRMEEARILKNADRISTSPEFEQVMQTMAAMREELEMLRLTVEARKASGMSDDEMPPPIQSPVTETGDKAEPDTQSPVTPSGMTDEHVNVMLEGS